MPPSFRSHLRFAAVAVLLCAPLVLSLLPYVLQDQGWAVLALMGGLAAVGGAFVSGFAYQRDLRFLIGFTDRLIHGESSDAVDVRTIPGQRLAAEVVKLNRKLTKRGQRAQHQLEINDAVIESLHDPLFLIGTERKVARVNAAARGLFGDRIVGRDLAVTLRQPDVLEAVDAVLNGGASRKVEYSLPVPVERTFEAGVKPFLRKSAADGDRMVILTLHDITAIRRSEQMRADFIANASHELRTPLSSLLGFIETLRGPAREDPEAGERFLSIMNEQATRMSRLVQDLLSLSRIELDEHMPPNERVDVAAGIRTVLDSLELKAGSRGIAFRLVVPERVPAVIGDDDQLTQVFQNLISNAVKYTRENTDVTITVSVTDGVAVGFGSALNVPGSKRPRAGSQIVAVAVADQGEGIPRTHLPRLTERFYRVDAARSRALGGTGLGLAIVKHVMNRHRGRLTIESEVGRGSTFTVYLPTADDETGETKAAGNATA